MLHNFNVRKLVNVTCVNKIEAMYEVPRVNVKVEPRLTVARATLIVKPSRINLRF